MKQFIINIGDNWNKDEPLKIEWAFSIPVFEETSNYTINGNEIIYNIDLHDETIGHHVILKVSQNDNIIYREYHTIN